MAATAKNRYFLAMILDSPHSDVSKNTKFVNVN